MKQYNLWLDDLRDPREFCSFYNDGELIWVRDYDSFVTIINTKGLPKIVSFDHDLGEDKDGKDCANWLVEYCITRDLDVPQFTVHSANPVGKVNIESYLENYHEVWLENHKH